MCQMLLNTQVHILFYYILFGVGRYCRHNETSLENYYFWIPLIPMILLPIHCIWCFLSWCHLLFIFHVPIIPLAACCSGIPPYNFISVRSVISCWIQPWLKAFCCSCVSTLFVLMSTVLCQAHICCYQGL